MGARRRGRRPAFPPIVLAVAGAFLVLSAVPQFFWLLLVFGWLLFPTLSVLYRSVAALPEGRGKVPAGSVETQETELLRALAEHGELTPARAAMETSLSVAQADRMLGELAEAGHLEVRVHGGGLFYALWEPAPGGTEGRA